MNNRFILVCLGLMLPICASAQTVNADFLSLRPNVRRGLTVPVPEKNPFRKTASAPVRADPTLATQGTIDKIKGEIGGKYIGGVIIPDLGEGEPQIIIKGHCFTNNDLLLVADPDGEMIPMIKGYNVRILEIRPADLHLEVSHNSVEDIIILEKVTLRYDNFFKFE